MIENEDISIVKNPACWSCIRTGKAAKLSKAYGMPILKVTYGVHKLVGKAQLVASCMMRESIYTALCDQTFTYLTADNPFGFVVVDREKKLLTPMVEVCEEGVVFPVF